jgi:uncharacterized protein YecT (DUF1311 family)
LAWGQYNRQTGRGKAATIAHMPEEGASRIKWRSVTWYSQLLALVLFVGVFALGFHLGKRYESGAQTTSTEPQPEQSAQQIDSGIFTVKSIESDLRGCSGANCLSVALQSYLQIEERTYQSLITEIDDNINAATISSDTRAYNEDAKKQLMASEDAWRTHRDALCKAEQDFWTADTNAPERNLSCQLLLTKKHIQDLLESDSGAE